MARQSWGKSERPGCSYLVGILPHRPFPRPCIFVLESRQIQNKQVWSECHIINYLLASLAHAELGNIGYRSFLYGFRCARSVLPIPRTNIPQYGPRARLVKSYFCGFTFKQNTVCTRNISEILLRPVEVSNQTILTIRNESRSNYPMNQSGPPTRACQIDEHGRQQPGSHQKSSRYRSAAIVVLAIFLVQLVERNQGVINFIQLILIDLVLFPSFFTSLLLLMRDTV